MFNWIKKQVNKESSEKSEERRKWLLENWPIFLEDDKEEGYIFKAKVMEAGLHLLRTTKKDPQEIEIWVNESIKWWRRF